MGKKKSRSENTATYQYIQAPPNPYYNAAAQQIEGYDGGAGGVREAHGRNLNSINEAASSDSFYGGPTSDLLKDRTRQSRIFRANNELGSGLANAKQNETAYKNSAYMGLGGATAPPLVQTGGTQYGENWGSGLYSPLGQFGLNAAGGGMAA